MEPNQLTFSEWLFELQTLSPWYEFIRDFQTAIVGIIGFSGVIITLAMNARSERARFLREITLRKNAVRGAIIAELSAVDAILRLNLSAFEGNHPTTKDGVLIERIDPIDKSSFSSDFGLLPRLEIDLALNSFSAVVKISEMIEVAGNRKTERFLVTDPALSPSFIEDTKRARRIINGTIEDLSSSLE